jgi:hypothetical protein
MECEDCGFSCSLEGSIRTYMREIMVREPSGLEVMWVCIACMKNYEDHADETEGEVIQKRKEE